MDTARQPTQLPIIMGLSSAALVLILIVSISTPLTALCIYSSPHTLPALTSLCAQYVCSMWSLVSPPAAHSPEPSLLSPRNIFLLVNLIIFFLFVSLHLQQHAPAGAPKQSSRKKRQPLTLNDHQSAPLQPLEGSSSLAGSAAAAMASEDSSIMSACTAAGLRPLQASMERFENLQGAPQQIFCREESSFNNGELVVAGDEASMAMDAEAAPMQESVGGLALISQETATVDSDHISGSDAEQVVDGRLRWKDGPKGADAEKIVMEGDGRLRLIDRPLPHSSRPEKSLSDNYYKNHKVYDESSSSSLLNNKNNQSFNEHGHDMVVGNLNHRDSKLINGGNNYGANSSIRQNLKGRDQSANKSSALRRANSKPMRVKKSDSMDATWKAINQNRGSGNSNSKHLIRQSSRKEFKPSRGGGGMMNMQRMHQDPKVRREPSIGQDELNAKVESFIAKFNEQIRIERQQSILSYLQMVDRGAN